MPATKKLPKQQSSSVERQTLPSVFKSPQTSQSKYPNSNRFSEKKSEHLNFGNVFPPVIQGSLSQNSTKDETESDSKVKKELELPDIEDQQGTLSQASSSSPMTKEEMKKIRKDPGLQDYFGKESNFQSSIQIDAGYNQAY